MKKRLVLLSLLLVGCSHSGGEKSSKASTVLEDLDRGRVTKIEVSGIVTEKLFNEAVTPGRLAQEADFRTTFDPRQSPLQRWMLKLALAKAPPLRRRPGTGVFRRSMGFYSLWAGRRETPFGLHR